jgi:hypothetical protein
MTSNKLFVENIRKINFPFTNKHEGNGGVFLTNDYQNLDKSQLSPTILFALETAKEKFDADAVYFRYFEDDREAAPQIYIYDNTNNHLTEKRRDIHVKVWSGCQVPMYIIIDKSEVSIYDARERTTDDKGIQAFETIKLSGQVIKSFTMHDFDNGLFWEEKNNEKRFKFEKSAYRDLISGLKKVYNSFQKDSGLDSHVALKLLVQCLLIKYLEERDQENTTGYFASTYFANNYNCTNFCNVIRSGKLLDLLDQLSVDFNGKIFEWNQKTELEARISIAKTEVTKLADYLDGDKHNDQYVLWRLYSFSHLPVELISSVYEELLTNSKDIVYTPEMIVSTLVDECMPLKSPKQGFKLIDVSCGSGIFLVKAYKRIIQWWRYERWQQTGFLEKPSLETLKELLLKSIYGIDIQEDAIKLSVFSLALALLDEVDLKPPVWQELKFPDLGEKNIISKDFFVFISQKNDADFDLVIGNPPFNPPTGENDKPMSNGVYFKKLKTEYQYESEIKIPDENPALHFLVQAMKLLKPNALLCLIQPSGPLFYQKDIEFKQALFSKYNLLQVIDFTKLSDVLWGSKNVATAAVFIQKSEPDNEDVLHIVANRTFSNVNRLFLEFDHYDFHSINKDAVINSPYIWKANLMGGGRIVRLIERIAVLRTINEFIEKKKKDGWVVGEGFIASEKGKLCNYITGKQFLPTQAFKENGINWNQTQICTIEKFHRSRNEKIYTPPHILLKANIGKKKLIAFFSEDYLVFKDKIIGIHAPAAEKNELQKLYYFLDEYSDVLRFHIACYSGQLSINRATAIIKDDLMNLPYPKDFQALQLSASEKIIIKEVLSSFFNNSINEKPKTDDSITQLKIFSNTFCQTLNSIYQTKNKAFRLFKILDAGKYYAVHFEYTSEDYNAQTEKIAQLEQYIEEIIPSQKEENKSYHTQRILKAYGKDCIILAKPKQLRYWLPSIALRDADEAFADYIKARYY